MVFSQKDRKAGINANGNSLNRNRQTSVSDTYFLGRGEMVSIVAGSITESLGPE
jgi:hypothetical protein